MIRRTDFSSLRHLLDDRIEIGADEQHLGAGVLDHVGHLGRRQTEIDRHQDQIGLGGTEPELEESRRVFGQNCDARLRPEALGDQSVCDLIGAAIELAEGEVPSLKMDRHPMRTALGVMARDIPDRGHVRNAIDLEHDVSSRKRAFVSLAVPPPASIVMR